MTVDGGLGGRADHGPYIAAVGRDLEARDIRVADVMVTTAGDGRREAALLLRPDEAAFADPVPEEVWASWDECDGWSLLVWDEAVASDVYKGLGVLPNPGDVSVWAVALLAHPEATPSRDGHPLRDHSVADPKFEVQLARYASAG